MISRFYCYLLERVVRKPHFGGLDQRGIRVRRFSIIGTFASGDIPSLLLFTRKSDTQNHFGGLDQRGIRVRRFLDYLDLVSGDIPFFKCLTTCPCL